MILRLSSVEPRHVDEILLAELEHPHLARHLHVPLQSADDGVLHAMGRPYTYAEYEARGGVPVTSYAVPARYSSCGVA